MRKKIVAGNWKMNCDLPETEKLLGDIKKYLASANQDVEIVVAPTFPNLYPAFQALKETAVSVAAQNMHESENGAFTGEVSARMLTSVGVNTVILGHSERRNYFHETTALLAQKVKTALTHDLEIMFCIGEQLEEREKDNHFQVIKKQLSESLFDIEDHAWSNIVIAYEPVWAIGTGKTASAEQAQEMHSFIRQCIADEYSAKIAEEVSILYGGSVKPNNAAEIFAKPDVDGGLIGGAALKAEDFLHIINAL